MEKIKMYVYKDTQPEVSCFIKHFPSVNKTVLFVSLK
jgi:hypothetical protein